MDRVQRRDFRAPSARFSPCYASRAFDKFELAVNMRTAKVIGLAIPQSVLLRADAAIQ